MNLYQDAEQVLACHVLSALCVTIGVSHPPIWAQPFGALSCSQDAGSAVGSSGGAAAASILILCSSAPAVRGTFAGFSSGVGVVDLPLEAPMCASLPAATIVPAPAAVAGAGESDLSTSSLVSAFVALAARPCLVGFTTVSGVAGALRLDLGGEDKPDASMSCGRCCCSRILLYMFEDSEVRVLASSDGHLFCLIWRMSTQFHLLRGLRLHLCDPCRLRLAPWFSALYFL